MLTELSQFLINYIIGESFLITAIKTINQCRKGATLNTCDLLAGMFPARTTNPNYLMVDHQELELCHESSCIVSDLFNHYLDHLIKFIKPTKEKKVILILGGRPSHTRLSALIEGTENGLLMLCLSPPQCIHRLWPFLDHWMAKITLG